ncbi:hypothetical protein [Streptomyces sp. KR80]|uniref:hypothetical protein n=1 Tax=Streptomyces sp. KR80 TaxID=3457426 RepID=UPI003FD2218C
MDWEEVADRLYGLPPDDFTSARDEAARSAPRGQAAKIRALRRPTLAAWAVNLLVRRDRDEIDALLALGEQLRRAHRELDGGQLRELSHQQHRLVTALSRRAQRLASEAGRPVGEGVLREVEATVHAVLADPDAADQLATGRLTKALEPPAAFGPPVTATVRRLRPRTAPSGRPATSGRSGRTRPEVRGRPGTVTQLSERAEEQARATRELHEQLDRARSLAEELERTARASDRESETAEQELTDAEERRQRAETRVQELESELRQARQDSADAKRAERRARSSARKAGDVAADDRDRASEAAEQVEQLLSQAASRGGRRRRR